ncbi:signal peptidase I [Enterococcus sp. 7F3_DIV0205]|uniref:Signal peptidase I n=1 Tax=Candidatus Enterococcus palustris TaxID=1834189 RepID=A0AAQ3WD82_9ENTE|nr:signal peptidase I [Enterococcus sp. 7F3_DIV0205]OTN83432.1 signal peptidase I [Enterococcus sp. 7F3_DIV0205]
MSAKRSMTNHSHPKNKKNSAINRKKKNKAKRLLERKQRQKKKRKARIKRMLLEFGLSLFFLGVVLFLLSVFTFSFTKVKGYSMIPTLNNGEWVFVNKLAKPKRFKLIVYKDAKSKETSVRRVIGMPQETIYYKEDKLYINDTEVYERFLETEIQRAKSAKSSYTEDWFPKITTIPKGKYLVLGDNRPYAADSREYGYIDEKEIVGVVEMRVLPIHQIQQF